VIAGPTAVGKTGLVIALASEYPIEVISLDSRQVYRGLRIGTAQPTVAEQAACAHHLIDFLAPEDTYTAQRFREDFCRVWEEIASRGRCPILAGGAGMYLKAVTGGLLPLPPGSGARLAEVRAAIAELDDGALDAELARVDPASHARLHANDRYRRARALEIFRLAGRPFSELAAGQEPDPALGLAFPLFVLERPVANLDARIASRTEVMLGAGWVEEVRSLLQDHAPDCPGLRSIGYAEVVRFLQGELAGGDLAPAVVRATRQYAKRQRTWFRPLERVAAGAPDDPALRTAIRAAVEGALGGA
jgi:tRNA dimethylallyltransferase